MIAPRGVPICELIGGDVLVSAASNPLHQGVFGSVVDETKNMLVIETETGVKRIPKLHSILRLNRIGSRVVEIDGSALMLAPEKRISLHTRKRIP